MLDLIKGVFAVIGVILLTPVALFINFREVHTKHEQWVQALQAKPDNTRAASMTFVLDGSKPGLQTGVLLTDKEGTVDREFIQYLMPYAPNQVLDYNMRAYNSRHEDKLAPGLYPEQLRTIGDSIMDVSDPWLLNGFSQMYPNNRWDWGAPSQYLQGHSALNYRAYVTYARTTSALRTAVALYEVYGYERAVAEISQRRTDRYDQPKAEESYGNHWRQTYQSIEFTGIRPLTLRVQDMGAYQELGAGVKKPTLRFMTGLGVGARVGTIETSAFSDIVWSRMPTPSEYAKDAQEYAQSLLDPKTWENAHIAFREAPGRALLRMVLEIERAELEAEIERARKARTILA